MREPVIDVDRCSICGEPAHASETDDYDRCRRCLGNLHDYEVWAADYDRCRRCLGNLHDYEVWAADTDQLGVTWWGADARVFAYDPPGGGAREWPEGPNPHAVLEWNPPWGWSVVQGPAVPADVLDRLNDRYDARDLDRMPSMVERFTI